MRSASASGKTRTRLAPKSYGASTPMNVAFCAATAFIVEPTRCWEWRYRVAWHIGRRVGVAARSGCAAEARRPYLGASHAWSVGAFVA